MLTHMESFHPPICAVSFFILLVTIEAAAQAYDPILQGYLAENQKHISTRRIKDGHSNAMSAGSLSSNNTWKDVSAAGGIVYAINTDATDPSRVFIGTNGGGLHKSTDCGLSWRLSGANEFVLIGGGELITGVQAIKDRVYYTASSGLYVSQDMGESWEALIITLSGFITDFVTDPTNFQVMYASHYLGGNPRRFIGVLKSTDGGAEWFAIDQGLASTDVTNLNMSARNPKLLYAATLQGLFMTMDGGLSGWQDISANLAGVAVYAIVVDETRDNELYAGTARGVFKRTQPAANWVDITGKNFKDRFVSLNGMALMDTVLWVGTRDGLYKSSDGGASWEEKVNGLSNTGVSAIEIVNPGHINLGTNDGFYRSTDGGESWHQQNRGLHAFDNTALAFDTSVSPSRVYLGTRGAGLYVSADAGDFWRDAAMDTGFTYVTAVAVHPDSQKILYGGLIKHADTPSSTISSGMYRSLDAGERWYAANAGLESSFLINAIVVNPGSAQELFAGTQNGLYKSINDGMSWVRKDAGIEVESITRLAFHPQNTNTIYAGTRNGTIESKLGMYRSTDGGEFWDYVSSGLPSLRVVLDFCINPQNPQTIYAAVEFNRLYKTTDGGDSWRPALISNDDQILSVAIDHQDTSRVYAGGFRIYSSDDAGKTWELFMDGLPDYFGLISLIRVDPADARRVYAATHGYGMFMYLRGEPTGVDEPLEAVPHSFTLRQNYPNPFNPSTTIAYDLPHAGKVTLSIYNLQGQLVRKLVDAHKSGGSYTAHWNGLDDDGQRVVSGVYLYRLVTQDFVQTRKMVLVQ